MRARSRAQPACAAPATCGGGPGGRTRPCPRRPARARRAGGPPRPEATWSGPKATSSNTVGLNSSSSGSWNTRPTSDRTRRIVSLFTARPATRTYLGGPERPVELEHEGALARPVGPDEGDLLARADAEVDAAEGLEAVRVAEVDVLELDGAASLDGIAGHRKRRLVDVRVGVRDLAAVLVDVLVLVRLHGRIGGHRRGSHRNAMTLTGEDGEQEEQPRPARRGGGRGRAGGGTRPRTRAPASRRRCARCAWSRRNSEPTMRPVTVAASGSTRPMSRRPPPTGRRGLAASAPPRR